MATCKIHPLTADHISKLANLVDEKIGTLIGDAAIKNKVADLAPWYELRGVIAQMHDSSGVKSEEKPARAARTPRAKREEPAGLASAPVIPVEAGDEGGAE